MAYNYTYDDFVTAANNAGMLGTFSQDDLTISQRSPEYGLSMLKLQQDAGKATTTEQKLLAQEAVNQLRKTYSALPTTTAANVTAPATSTAADPVTADGTASSAVPQATTGYSYSGQNAYQKALEGVTGFAPYSYDYRSDPTYTGMRDTYLGDNQAMEDRTLNNPAVTGGGALPSYATAAAGQSANYYATRLNDIIPQMEQNAYEQYLKDYQIKNTQLDLAAGDKEYDYNMWKKQQELELAAIQQKYANDQVLHRTFGQDAPALPDLSRVGTGSSMAEGSAAGAAPTAAAGAGTAVAAGTEGTGTDAAAPVPELLAPVYSYGKQNEYQAALDGVLNNPEFHWTAENDPQYESLRKSYLREGQRANDNVLARASAGTMGIPSSYAIRQAVDAGNGYNEQLMQAVPNLKENAYGRYITDFNNAVAGLQQLGSDRELDYNQWLQNYQLEQKVKQQNFDNAVAQYRLTGQLTPEIAAALGIEYKAPVAFDYGYYGPYTPVGNTHNDMVHKAVSAYNGALSAGASLDQARKEAAEIAGNWYQAYGKYA